MEDAADAAVQVTDQAAAPGGPPGLVLAEGAAGAGRAARRRPRHPAAGCGPGRAGRGLAAVSHGLAVLPPALLAGLLGPSVSNPGRETRLPVEAGLTRREREVLDLLAAGASNKVIARRLGLSFHTAKAHVAAVLQKLGAGSRADAVARGARAGLVLL